MLDFHKLDVFLKVIETGSFSRAGEALLITQSAVSHHMRDLETQLGTSLFKRGPRGVTLTTSGELLNEYVLKITTLVAEAERAVTNVANIKEEEVKVGATPGVSAYLLPDCIVLFRQEYPNLLVTMQTDTSQQVIHLLNESQVDLGIIEGELEQNQVPGLKVQALHQIEQKVIVGKNHLWWDRAIIELAELNDQEFVMRQPSSQTRIWLDSELKQHGIQPHVTTVFDNVDSIKRAVVRGQCLTVMPAYAVQDELEQGTAQALSIEGQPLQRTLKLVWKEAKPFSPPASAFLRHMEECLVNQRIPV
ncbi:MAG: LysR family transcriptional regulator [Chloroflexota bacterium]